jgi:general secretion pathway protein D
VPFITATNLSSTGLSQQSVERKDVGIDLKITPQISEGEYVKLDIYQEISAVVPTLKSANTVSASDLVTTKRSTKTSIVVKDKETVVIGGLIQDQETETENKVPLLGDIPGLGWLFKNKNKQRTKTNLLIVLTPRIIRGAEEMAEVSGAQKGKFNDAVRMDKPFNLEGEMQLKP